ncbi:MAG: hypothetical protein ACRDJX_08895, partial [Solirubrobacteraceae bacterium]
HRQQHFNDGLPASVIDRFRLDPLHTTGFDAELCPPTHQLNAYLFPAMTGFADVSFRGREGLSRYFEQLDET